MSGAVTERAARRGDRSASAATADRVWRAHLRGEAAGLAPTRLAERQWDDVANLACRHQLGALTYRLVTDGPLGESVTAAARERLRSVYVQSAVRNALFFRGTARAAAALREAGIPVLLLKGVHLARFVYPEPALRTMADVDLMVPRDRLAQAEQVLLDLGYGPTPRPDPVAFCAWSNHLAKLYLDGAPVVELHWTIERPTSPFRIDLDGLWARSRPVELEGVEVRVLAPEDLLLHLVLHVSYHHGFERSALKALVDVDAVARGRGPGLDWAILVQRANAWGASRFAYTTLRLANELLGTGVPGAILDALRHEPADEELVATSRPYILAPQSGADAAFSELARARGLAWLRLSLRHAFPPPRQMEAIYGLPPKSPLVFPYYVRRLVELGFRRSSRLLATLFGARTRREAHDHEAARRAIERWQHAGGGTGRPAA